MANKKNSMTSSQENGSIGGNMTKKAVERAKQSTDTEALKQEVAAELGITPGKNATAEENGRIGGEMTKKLYNKGSKSNSKKSSN